MRKIRTRAFSILLTCAMLLSLLPVTALANGEGDDTTATTIDFAGETFTANSIDDTYQLPVVTAFPSGKTVYDGVNYYATMIEALEGIHRSTEKRTLWCKPGADVGEMTHGHVCADLTIYGNGAYVSTGEHDFELDTYDDEAGHEVGTYLTQDVDLTIYDLNGCAVWGQRNSNYTLNITLENCKNMNRVYLSGTSGTNNITLKNCSFDGTRTDALKASSCTVYSNAPGTITLENCAFTSVQEPINLNNKADADTTQTINVTNCAFTDCSTEDICIDDVTWAAPIRIVSSAGAVSNLNINGCNFVYNSGKASVNGDILLGDGREGDDKASYPVYANISGTNAEVQIQNPGDRTSNANNAQKISVTSSEGETNLTNAVAENTTTGQTYTTLKDAVDAAGSRDTITLLTDVTNGGGVVIESGSNLTIDFDGHTYTVTHDPAGSPGSKTQCFQLLRDSTITMKNGAVVANSTILHHLIQNYADLTLENMTLDATQGENSVSYALSNNCGDVVLTGNTNITAKAGGVAFDVYYWPDGGYDEGVSVTLDENMTGTISGTVESRNIEVHDFASTGMPICTIASDGQIQVDFGVTERTFSNISVGEAVSIEKGGNTYEATVTEIGSMLNAATGLYDVTAVLNEQADLANGSRVKLTVVRDQALGAMTVPLSAVNYDGGIPYVYCLENGIAVRTDVEVGIHDEERIEILGGLEDGSQVIYSWSNELVDGAEVLLKGASEATEESGQEAGEDA